MDRKEAAWKIESGFLIGVETCYWWRTKNVKVFQRSLGRIFRQDSAGFGKRVKSFQV